MTRAPECVILIGLPGAGKSTLVKAIFGLLPVRRMAEESGRPLSLSLAPGASIAHDVGSPRHCDGRAPSSRRKARVKTS